MIRNEFCLKNSKFSLVEKESPVATSLELRNMKLTEDKEDREASIRHKEGGKNKQLPADIGTERK